MILERRQYDLKLATAGLYWDAQQRWNRKGPVMEVVRCNLGHFESVVAGQERIVHLYAYESHEQMREKYAYALANHAKAYFLEVRPLFHRQQNAIYIPAPHPELNSARFGGVLQDPAEAVAAAGSSPADLCVVEEVIDLQPGALPAFWEAYRGYLDSPASPADHQLIGAFSSTIGALNQVLQYRWFDTADIAAGYFAGLATDAAWASFSAAIRPSVVAFQRNLLRPSPKPWLRSVLQKVDWEALEGS